jgi:lysine-N-methylase
MPVLHALVKSEMLSPRYAAQFQCIGPRCEDNCCTGWRVTIDRKTYAAYKASGHAALKTRFEEAVTRQRSGQTDSRYGLIGQQQASGECVFLEDRLCAVQRELGPDLLSNTCAEYPRVSRRAGAGVEQALTLSCPEAARLALLPPRAMEFVVQPTLLRKEAIDAAVQRKGWADAQLVAVRDFCLQLMLTEALELWQRLAVLGLFCEKLDALEKLQRGAGVPALIDEFTRLVAEGSLSSELAAVQPFHEIQAHVFFGLWLGRARARYSPHQEQVRREVLRGLGADAGEGADAASGARSVPASVVTSHYTRGVHRLSETLAGMPHLLQNYLVNEMFREFFPFSARGAFDHYQELLVRFGMVRLLLAARCNAAGDEAVSAAALADTVQVFCRRFQHDATFATQLSQVLRNAGWDRLDKLFRFLRS